MTRTLRLVGCFAAGVIVLAGCGSANTAATPTSPSEHTPGMVMPDGSTMGAPSPAAKESSTVEPSEATKMICTDETRTDITKVLGLDAPPPTESSWKDRVYTCTYALPTGPLVLSVKQSADPTAAKDYFAGLRPTLGDTSTLTGLGEASYGAASGKVVVVKDNATLMVDAAAQPAVLGAYQAKRADFAFQVAAVILACWIGHE